MSRFVASIAFLLATEGLVTAARSPIYTPSRITYAALKSDPQGVDDPFLDPLVTDGLISVTDIPGFKDLKKNTLSCGGGAKK